MIECISAQQAQALIGSEQTCVLNIVAAWCSDCTKQSKNINAFAADFIAQGISVYELNVQNERNLFVSPLHQHLTAQFGGHGFPRTVLIQKGNIVDADNVEIISKEQLTELTAKFKAHLQTV